MSTLNVSNITDGTTTVGTSYVVNGSAKAWASFHHVSGVPTLSSGSLNVSSLADNGTGEVGVNFSSSFNSVQDYACVTDGWDYATRTGAMGTTSRKPAANQAILYHYENGIARDAASGANFPLMIIAMGDLA
jgi:hypothetical protein